MGLIPVWCVGSLRLVAVLGVVVGGLLLLDAVSWRARDHHFDRVGSLGRG